METYSKHHSEGGGWLQTLKSEKTTLTSGHFTKICLKSKTDWDLPVNRPSAESK